MTAPRQLKLARRALRTALTHLRAAQHLGTLAVETRTRLIRLADAILDYTQRTHELVADAVLDAAAARVARRASRKARAA